MIPPLEGAGGMAVAFALIVLVAAAFFFVMYAGMYPFLPFMLEYPLAACVILFLIFAAYGALKK